MNFESLVKSITEIFSEEPDNPFKNDNVSTVFRHSNNNKWFALLMKIPKNRLGEYSDKIVDIVNVKCDPIMLGSLLEEKGFYPAYHMNKEHWITICLDGSVDDEKILSLIDISYDLTVK
ncbi:MAG: MmcQ/YjbR family DNA-binding protein [Ruminococcus sp.]|nr:MmcQ/YjbR family DNA-binding protein [Ruminococcus sp.]MDD5889480.1 MmcQ/YjbR family DNA-binding protein [Ruminococcus sp.]